MKTLLFMYYQIKITKKLMKEYDFVSEARVKAICKKMLKHPWYRWSVKVLIKNNFDMKPIILRLVIFSFWFNFLFVGLSAAAGFFYTGVCLSDFVGLTFSDSKANWPWIGILITNVLYLFFIIKTVSDYYKLSLRGDYRKSYLKLLFLDILTLNIFSVIATLIFVQSRYMLIINDDQKFVHDNLNSYSQGIKKYCKVFFQLNIFFWLIILLVFPIALTFAYFVELRIIKIICLAFVFGSMLCMYALIIDATSTFIIYKMLKTFLHNNSYHYFLTLTRFIMFGLGLYFSAIFICLINFNDVTEQFVLENW